MATAAPAATSASTSSAPAPSGAGSDSPSPGASDSAPVSSRPVLESEGSFYGTSATDTPTVDPALDADATDEGADPNAPTDPDAIFASVLESLSPEQRSALEQRDHQLRRDAARAKTAQKQGAENYSAAEAWSGLAAIAIQRLKGAGIDTSDLESGEAQPGAAQTQQARPAASDFDAKAATSEALATLSPEWNNNILDAQEQADEWAQAAADYKAAGDEQKAGLFRKQARDLRAKINAGIAHSAVLAASKIADKSHAALSGRFGSLEGKLSTEESAASSHNAMGQALAAASIAVDDTSGTRTWFDRGFFATEGGKVVLTPLARELTEPMQQWAADRGADLSNPDDFNDAFWSSMGRLGKLRRNAAGAPRRGATPTPGDPTSGLVGPGTLSPAVPRRQPTSALPSETPDERAARTNRRAFA